MALEPHLKAAIENAFARDYKQVHTHLTDSLAEENWHKLKTYRERFGEKT